MSIESELASIQKDHGGVLSPVHVVDFAQDKGTALHSRFEWDNRKAGTSFRIWQARQLISLIITVHPIDNEPMRAMISLRDDRHTGGGYRMVDVVLQDDVLARKMFDDAMFELRLFRRKYERIMELNPIFQAMDAVEKHSRCLTSGRRLPTRRKTG